MSDVAKVIEVNAGSKKSFEDAVRTGLSKVAGTVGNIRGAWISETKVVTTPDGDIEEWRVCMRVTFVVD